MAGDLYQLVESTTRSSERGNKVKMGYTVNTYGGVLEQLSVALKNIGVANNVNGDNISVMGDDYSKLNDIRFDSNNFSTNPEAALWRMEIGLFGSIPFENENSKIQIITVDGDDKNKIAESGNTRQLPFVLDTGELINTQDTLKFETGAFIDIDNHLVAYLNQMFTHAATEGGQNAFTKDLAQALVSKKALVAQIIPQNGAGSVEVTVIGRTVVSNNSRIMLNPTFAVSSACEPLKIPVVVGNYQNGSSTEDVDLMGDGILSCPLKGKSYNKKDASMTNLNHQHFKNWASEGKKARPEESQAVSLKQISPITAYVRIYIPSDKKNEVIDILPKNVSDGIFTTYSAAKYGGVNKAAAQNTNVARMKECIVEVMDAAGYKRWTKNDIVQGDGDAKGGAFNWGYGWVGSAPQGQAMAGYFLIPVGWPMCVINQNYGMTEGEPRSAEDQARKGLPGQSNDLSKELPWVIPEKGNERMDIVLNSLDSSILNGTKDKSWYQERINKANLGAIKVHCAKCAEKQFNDFFGLMWNIYSQAAARYNTGRSEEEQVSTGELILRCAPCLCAMNGGGCLHRSRKKKGVYRTSGHDVGRAIDFDPINNLATDNYSRHCATPFVKDMDSGYAPMLYALKALGGGWGGSYRFMGDNFDSMHIGF